MRDCQETCCLPCAIQEAAQRPACDFTVALAGHPNTGKSTVFNHLTGLRQHTGNWPGKTVSRAEGTYAYAGSRFRLIDLPGTYSLIAQGRDEEIARDFLLFEGPACTVVVCDATLLQRNVHLVLQVMEITDRIVVGVNLMDEADRHGLTVNTDAMEQDLGVPVVPLVARMGKGIDRLKHAICGIACGRRITTARRCTYDPAIENAIGVIQKQLSEHFPDLSQSRWVALRLLAGDERIMQRLCEEGAIARPFSQAS